MGNQSHAGGSRFTPIAARSGMSLTSRSLSAQPVAVSANDEMVDIEPPLHDQVVHMTVPKASQPALFLMGSSHGAAKDDQRQRVEMLGLGIGLYPAPPVGETA